MHRLRKDILTPQELVSPLTPGPIGLKGLPFSGRQGKPCKPSKESVLARLWQQLRNRRSRFRFNRTQKMPSFQEAFRRPAGCQPMTRPVCGFSEPAPPKNRLYRHPLRTSNSAPRHSASVPAVCGPATRRVLDPPPATAAMPRHSHDRRKSGRGDNPSASPATTVVRRPPDDAGPRPNRPDAACSALPCRRNSAEAASRAHILA